MLLDAFCGRWWHGLQKTRPELKTVLPVIRPCATCLYELTGRDDGGMSDHSHEFTLAAGFDAKDRKAVFLIVECHALYKTSQNFGRGLFRFLHARLSTQQAKYDSLVLWRTVRGHVKMHWSRVRQVSISLSPGMVAISHAHASMI